MIDRRLVYVVSTARYGSFTAAADRVGVTQSAITKSVADLERELGYSIFNRTARGVLLTEEGRSFVERASRLLDEAQDLLQGASTGSDPYAGVLRIGVCPSSLEWLLVEPLSTLISRHPNIRLHISGGTYDGIVQQLRVGAIDVALGYEAAFQEHPDFRREPMAPLQTIFFARKGHPILDCDEVTKAEIAKYDLVVPSGWSPYNFVWRQIYEDSGVDFPDRPHIVDYFPIVTKLVRNSDAISIAAIHYTRTSVFKRHFERVPDLDLLTPSPLCCATRLRWNPRPAVRAFIKACRERLPSSETIPRT
ncbi:transcriptional regulator, LysR family [Parvibaculum lavamentivorans DS-1]|uniref:Transcriptional regulator, LysR family n=1 Tax=Parvibaculum lavamentivorans (strain DS-1 / DSM 13023 / NCIMB 13966) TaxID=402881 RepID=A7HRX2_PARL1|nr:LysR family transcriptional regulator [Parvibaculum lavamentivorans]ABS62655.1 transcriptional regulator, LysR family [Parvibaculum lavamentivorans DS-1]